MAEEKKKKEKKSWLKGMKAELKKVTWQTPRQLAKNTAAVITLVLIVALIVFILDMAFKALNEQGVERLKTFVQNNETVQVEDNTIDNSIDNTVDLDSENSTTEENVTVDENQTSEEESNLSETEENNIVEE